MNDLNKFIIGGRLVRQPHFHHGESGTLIALFTIAANHHYEDKRGRRRDETAFVPCKVFGKWAESLTAASKGDMLLAAGRLLTESWERDGTSQGQLTLICEAVYPVSNRKIANDPQAQDAPDPAGSVVEAQNGDIPF